MKDELKRLYNIKWDAKTKLWYVGEMVEGLKPYTIMKIQVEYDDKDIFKSRYKSMKWRTMDKTWTCSYDDYMRYLKDTTPEKN